MGRIAVKFYIGKDLRLKASNVERACGFCSAVFGAQLQLCPTCEEVYLCEACKPQHMYEDNNGKIGIAVDDQNIVMDVVAKSPAAVAGIQIGDIIQCIDGVATSDDVVPRIIGPIGSNVTLTLCHTQLQTPPTIFTVTIRRGREPRSAGPAMAMASPSWVCHRRAQMGVYTRWRKSSICTAAK
jgi:membrane-associated protease RseP (regulator of RpoE activity)